VFDRLKFETEIVPPTGTIGSCAIRFSSSIDELTTETKLREGLTKIALAPVSILPGSDDYFIT
jgi:hypothetical protein